MIFDTHTHSYFPEISDRQDEIITHMINNKVCYATQIGCDEHTSKQAIELAHAHECFFATVGYHPTEGQSLMREDIPKIVEQLGQLVVTHAQKIVAIGEIGFDYYHLDPEKSEEQKETQRLLFLSMTELAIKHDLPIVVHSREARADTLRYIKESGIKKVIIHCFSEDYDFAQELMDYSDEVYFSFS